ncbi:lanthionine synthetase C family protein [Streptomyces luteolus]|uniref:Lanthionine synthetase C family protein n=1 Tax=Streptomyces luteolus TaxID=3043615 RepID=A0ABT6T217_9ACTN|nr:lanthionine synthetase C family protein [Streptomyces sp. B-S-A12]MDI3421909.1 lanthionine synthetase C family protein [Streptomyces sp. B-S-A12]
MITNAPAPTALSTADRLAEALADPHTVLPSDLPEDGRAWPQSLAGGASGIALLHIERARTGRGDWSTADAWLRAALAGEISAAANANLFFGAPALAFVVHRAASASSRYARLLERLDSATATVTERRLAAARRRIDRGVYPPMEEFDLIQGLAGIGAHHLSRHPEHEIAHDVLAYLVRLTEPLPGGAGLPPWWMEVGPTGAPHPDYPGGHGNFGLAHGIGAVLAVLSQAALRGSTTPGLATAIERICAWMDHWRHGDEASPWWPGQITREQASEQHIHQDLRPRPSWCYGASGTARAQQLAGLALGDQGRVRTAESAILSALRDPLQQEQLPDIGLCHGMAGLLHAAWRMGTDTGNPQITAELRRLADRLISALHQKDHPPEVLDGTAGAALALHTFGIGRAPAPHWDTFLALA